MASYIEAAAACDLAVVEKSPVRVDMSHIREAQVRRAVLRKPVRTPETRAARCAATPGGLAPLQAGMHSCCCAASEQLRSLLREVMDSKPAWLLPRDLRARCERAAGMTPRMTPASEALSPRPVSPISPDDPLERVGQAAGAQRNSQVSDTKRSVGFRATEDGSRRATIEVEVECGPSPSSGRLRRATIVRAENGRRYTLSHKTAPPAVEEEEEDDERCPTNEGAQSRWKVLQPRLAELCVLQTMLQTFTPDDGEPVYRVVLTGGPCAGKSTGTAMLRQALERNGINVFCVPEAATLLIGGGCGVIFKDCDDEKLFRFQLALLETQLALEDAFFAIAKATRQKGVLLCDRGAMDGRAFCSESVWARILQEGDWTTQELRDGRYDMVVHLVTAADGAANFYGTENNQARTETPEQAVEQDRKLQKMWTGHPKVRIVDNSTPFAEKMERTMQPILELVGIDRRPGPYKKYAVGAFDPSQVPVHTERSEVTLRFLRGSRPDNQSRLFLRTDSTHEPVLAEQRSHITYTFQNFRIEQDQVFRCESHLNESQYNAMCQQVDPHLMTVRRKVLSFVYANQYFELGTYVEPQVGAGETFVWVETQRGADGKPLEIILPDWLRARGLQDVSHEAERSDLARAQGGFGALVSLAALKNKQQQRQSEAA
eukprot:TRINITY_DN4617_c0_g1_i2.p1 TRINITY_DN4617_c0_g1~~TRINITY_DN4617_c0_g1_i2.p1  ORF type:complete len:659 (+),score=219.08 TRINITY_DN4617_c0_g1_i2:148-2124(+)